ncbi:outer membrane beta-barrel family protein [Chitinophaga flava]|nr:outer membrane beta-barrel family protein [Chitinophaga flava]
MNYKILAGMVMLLLILFAQATPAKTHSILEGQINGQVMDAGNSPVPFAAIYLIKATDSAVVGRMLTDATGQYQFSGIAAGDYLIKVTVLGFNTAYSGLIRLSADATFNAGTITITPSVTTLSAVEIAGRKATVERKADRFVLNVEKSAMAAGNSIDLLKSTPFVSLSSSNEVKLQGRKTMFLVDGKPVPEASVQDILQMIPAGNIATIELITNPSSKYDAAYGAVINIITRKKQLEGITGNIRAEGAQGKYGEYGANGRLTYKKNQTTLFGMAGYTKRDQQSFNGMDKELGPTQNTDLITENITRTFYQHIYSLQAGAEFGLTDNQTLGILATGRINRSTGLFESQNDFSRLHSPLDSSLFTGSPLNNKGATYNFNLNYHLISDSGKNELTLLTTYTPYRSDFFQSFTSRLADAKGNTIRTPADYRIDNKTDIDIYIAQADYTHSFSGKWKLESGLKYQYTNSANDILYEDNSSGKFVKTPDFSSNNHLKESIYAGYAIASKDWGKNKIEAGVRAENTSAEYIGNFSQHYFKLFPTFTFQHDFNDQYNFNLSYKKTISRAPYNELVPYTIFINQYTVFTGNPALQPQIDQIIALNTTLKKVNISFVYTLTKGMFGQFPLRQDYDSKVTYFATQNLDNASDFHIDIFYPQRITSWWSTENSGSAFGYSNAEGTVLGKSFSLSSTWFNVKSSHTFECSKNVKLEIVAYYTSALTSELTKIGSVGNIDASLLINILQNKGQIRISGTDILQRNVYYSAQYFDMYRSQKNRYVDSRRLGIGFTYNFGKTKIATPPKKLGNNDALQRIQ